MNGILLGIRLDKVDVGCKGGSEFTVGWAMCVGVGPTGVKGERPIVTGVRRIRLRVKVSGAELGAWVAAMFALGAACTESKLASLSSFFVLSFFVVLMLLRIGCRPMGCHVV